ncbi:hypothetical protein B6U96_11315 [Archaeoglobales archaeon ex4484_92]|nr:MAG: hypothetical protein B6U96_11315 [Archaeoglobales archaeon ex4484_92]
MHSNSLNFKSIKSPPFVEDSVVEIRYDPLTLQTSRIVKKSLSIKNPFISKLGRSIFKLSRFTESVEFTKTLW